MFPLGLVALGIGSFLLYDMRRVDQQEENPFSQVVTEKSMISYYDKLEDFMTPRGFGTEQEIEHLVRVVSFIEGSLSHMNTGMNIESEKSLTKSGRIWKEFIQKHKGGSRESNTIAVNYVTASNPELVLALSLGEALPNLVLESGQKITFSPQGETSQELVEWAQQASLRGKGQALSYDGIDWSYLVEELETTLDQWQK